VRCMTRRAISARPWNKASSAEAAAAAAAVTAAAAAGAVAGVLEDIVGFNAGGTQAGNITGPGAPTGIREFAPARPSLFAHSVPAHVVLGETQREALPRVQDGTRVSSWPPYIVAGETPCK